MRRWIALIAACVATASLAQTRRLPVRTAQLLVLATPHFSNRNLDVANIKVEDVLTPARQREIEALVTSLARFHPNHVAVEWPATEQDRLDRIYASYNSGHYVLRADEVDQIGPRLAAKLGLSRVDAVNWNESPPGPPADYDFQAWAQEHGRGDELAALAADTQAHLDALSARNRCRPVADWLREMNSEQFLETLDRPYYRVATLGDQVSNPGAAWVGSWHGRNLRIYANLLRVAGGPGDRTIAIFGAGHATLLRSYASASGKFSVVDPKTFLPRVSKAGC